MTDNPRPSAENDAPRHRPECWCSGTGWRVEFNSPCALPQLSDLEADYLTRDTTPAANAGGEGK